MRGHALQHRGGGGFEIDRSGNLHQLPGRDHGIFGVGSARHGVSHAIAQRDVLHVGPHGFHRSRAFAAQHDRRRGGINALAEIDIDEIDARCRNLHQRLAGAGRRFRNVRIFQILNAAGLFDKDSFHSVRRILRK